MEPYQPPGSDSLDPGSTNRRRSTIGPPSMVLLLGTMVASVVSAWVYLTPSTLFPVVFGLMAFVWQRRHPWLSHALITIAIIWVGFTWTLSQS